MIENMKKILYDKFVEWECKMFLAKPWFIDYNSKSHKKTNNPKHTLNCQWINLYRWNLSQG